MVVREGNRWARRQKLVVFAATFSIEFFSKHRQGTSMEARRPGLRQAHAGTDLLQCLVVIVVMLDEESLFVGESLHHPSDPLRHLLALDKLGRGRLFVGDLLLISLIEHRHEHRRHTTEGIGEFADSILDLGAIGTIGTALGLRLDVAIGLFLEAHPRILAAWQPAHRAQTIEHCAPDSVIGKGRKGDAVPIIEPLRCLEQTLHTEANQIIELDHGDLLTQLACDRADERDVVIDQPPWVFGSRLPWERC